MIIAGIDPSINGTGITKFKLDDDLDIINQSYFSFSTVKKHTENSNIVHIRKKDFSNKLAQNDFVIDYCRAYCGDCDYVSIEDYAYGAKGLVFDIAEFVGCLKRELYLHGLKIRMIEPSVVKKFATGKGNCDKKRIEDVYMKTDPLDIDKKLPEYKSPKLDIIDSYYIAKFLQLELKLRSAKILLQQLPKEHIEIFNRVTKAHPVNILARDFIENDV